MTRNTAIYLSLIQLEKPTDEVEFMNEELVSIIMSAYNCEKFIGEAIDSVLNQSYGNWELIIVNDCSVDDTEKVIKEYALKDKRIHYFTNERNFGAAISRNNAIKQAKGRFLAFLDSDDIWKPNKLMKQIDFMLKNNCTFTCTMYDKIDENSNSLNHIIEADKKSDYYGVLKKCPGNSTIIYDASVLGKHFIPDIKKRNDYVMWLQVIKKAKFIYGVQEVLGSHRVSGGSLSSNKKTLVKYHWYVYRKIENLSFAYSTYLIFYWVLRAVFKA